MKILTIIPIYNRAKYLNKAIESVLNQTHSNVDLVLIDDCSTDDSLQIALEYASLDNVTLLQNSQNMGCYYSRNIGLYEFKDKDWDFFTIHDADDYSESNRFEEIIKPFSNPNLLGLKTTYIRVDENGNPQPDREDGDRVDIYSSEGIAIFPRATFDFLGYYDDTRFSGDTDYWWRLEQFCNFNKDYSCGKHLSHLYYAVSHEENLTKIYNFTEDRPKYFQKSRSDIIQMYKAGSFKRNFSPSL